MRDLNLARRPFVNARPVVRLAVVLWIVGGALCAANVWLYGTYWASSAEIRGQLAAVDEATEVEREHLERQRRQVDALDLAQRSQQAQFLNQLIDDRTFPWSALFDDLEHLLPIDCRLQSVQPQVEKGTAGRSSRRRSVRPVVGGASDRVTLSLEGSARSDDALIELVNALYQDPSFVEPELSAESRNTGGSILFSIRVVYLTRPTLPNDAVANEAAAAGEDEENVVELPAPPAASPAANPLAGGPPAATGAPPPTVAAAPPPGAAPSPPPGAVSGPPPPAASSSSTVVAAPPPLRPPPAAPGVVPPNAPPARGTFAGAPVVGAPAVGAPVVGAPVGSVPAPAVPPRPVEPAAVPPPAPANDPPAFLEPAASGSPRLHRRGGGP